VAIELGALLLTAACDPMGGTPPPKQGADILIGVPLAATGSLAAEAAQARQGYDLWTDWANRDGGIVVQGVRHRVKLQYEDDASDPAKAAQVATGMVTQENVQFLLGPYGTTNTGAVAAVADKAHVVLSSSNGAARQIFTQGFRYVFGVLAPADQYPQGVIDMSLAMNPKPATMAIITADDIFSLAVAKGAGDYATAKGIKVVFVQQYPSGSTNLFSVVQQVKAKNPDIFVNTGHFVEAIAAHKAARDLRLDAKLFVYAIGPTQPEFVQLLGGDANYVVTGSPWSAEAKYKAAYYLSTTDYLAAFRKKYNTQAEPGFGVADATAAGVALQAAIERAQSLNSDRVRDAMAALDVETFYGRLKFDPQGQNTYRSVLVQQIQNGQLATTWPPELANAQPMYPTPSWTVRLGLPPAPPKAKLPGTGKPPAKR
jgi:branched-chain amino acid transport system substrate-binding protein